MTPGAADPQPLGCSRQPEAGSYLLGALSPAERADYAAHLDGCRSCLREVGQLAGLPGLLGRGSSVRASASPAGGPGLPPDAAAVPPEPAAARPAGEPATGQPAGAPRGVDPVEGALRAVYRARRQRRALAAAAGVLLIGLGVTGTVLTGGGPGRNGPGGPVTGVSAAADLPVRMQPVGNVAVSAAVALTPQPWGTEVVMRCRYAGAAQSPVYTLVARAADGTVTELARWSAVTDQDMVLASATELVGPRLAELEVRNAAGAVVLRADRPS